MGDDVQNLRKRYTYLTNIAAYENKAINRNVLHVSQLDQKVNYMANYTTTIRGHWNMYTRNFHSLFLFQIPQQALSALKASASSFLQARTLIIQNLVDAARGRVTAALSLSETLKQS